MVTADRSRPGMIDARGWMRVGEMWIAAVSDGFAYGAPQIFFPEADWMGDHAHLIDDDGLFRMPVGGFVVRSAGRTILIDAGVGPSVSGPFADSFVCGELPRSLAALGVMAGDIDLVLCSHLHIDHAGWLADDGEPYFPNATVRFGDADWDALIMGDNPLVGDRVRENAHLLAERGRLLPIAKDGEEVAPGINARSSPGHTPGHQVFILSSGIERLVILGDAIACPLQITNPDMATLADVDPKLAAKTRERLLRELEGQQVVGPHFPGLKAGRILRGNGRSLFTFGPSAQSGPIPRDLKR